jgi:hypothetical protein
MRRQAYLDNAGLRLPRGSPLRIGYVAGRMASQSGEQHAPPTVSSKLMTH